MIMGNIRTSFVKTVSTKHLRNKIAGYITRLVRQQANQA